MQGSRFSITTIGNRPILAFFVITRVRPPKRTRLKYAELSRIGVVEPWLISVGLARRFPGICVVYAQVDAIVLRPDGRHWVVQFPDVYY